MSDSDQGFGVLQPVTPENVKENQENDSIAKSQILRNFLILKSIKFSFLKSVVFVSFFIFKFLKIL